MALVNSFDDYSPYSFCRNQNYIRICILKTLAHFILFIQHLSNFKFYIYIYGTLDKLLQNVLTLM